MQKYTFGLICLLLTIFTLKINAQEQLQNDLLRACKGDKCGYINRKGKMIIKPQFVYAADFSEGLASISFDKKKWGFIDTTGKVIIPPQFENVNNFSDGLAAFEVDDKHGFIDRTGKIVIEPTLYYAANFSEGLAQIMVKQPTDKEARTCFINTKGEIVIPCNFDDTFTSFSQGYAFVGSGGLYGYINKTGKWVIEPQFARAESFSEGLAAVQINGKWGYINMSGKIVIEPQFETITPFSAGLAAVRFFFINTSGYKELSKYGYIDRTGQVVIPHQFQVARKFSEGLAVVSAGVEHKESAYIDRTGKRISGKHYTNASEFKNGIAYVEKANFLARLEAGEFGGLAIVRTYYIDKSEKVIWKGKD